MSDSLKFNPNAKAYVPKNKQQPNENQNSNIQDDQNVQQNQGGSNKKEEALNFNLNAQEFKPKIESKMGELKVSEGLDVEEEEPEIDENEILDGLVDDEINNYDPMPDDDDESDEDKWFPKFKDCTCCQGYIYKCSGDVCSSLGVCFCKAQEDYDPDV